MEVREFVEMLQKIADMAELVPHLEDRLKKAEEGALPGNVAERLEKLEAEMDNHPTEREVADMIDNALDNLEAEVEDFSIRISH